jgi:putative glutamine amidotransferase
MKSETRNNSLPGRIAIIVLFLIFWMGYSAIVSEASGKPVSVGIAWSNVPDSYSYTSTIMAVKEAGATPVILDMVKSYDLNYDKKGNLIDSKDEHGILTSRAAKLVKCNQWQNSNAAAVMKGIDCIIFPGGWDISPTLYYNEQPWHGIEVDSDYSAERDVSDYLLFSYCLEKNIPTLAICRGMQMLSIVSGAEIVQDIPRWFAEEGAVYRYQHRDRRKKGFQAHGIDIMKQDSLLFGIVGRGRIEGCPSWHHQAVRSVDATRLVVTATADTDGIKVIEGVERPDKKFVLGIQFHPEVAIRKILKNEQDADQFMDYETVMKLFRALIDAGAETSNHRRLH